jgi:transcriptional regulator with XRE-family HTH domain
MPDVSKEFLIRLKLAEEPAYKIAQQAGINSVTLSRLINGIDPVKPNDERIIKVAKVLGLSEEEAFEEAEAIAV